MQNEHETKDTSTKDKNVEKELFNAMHNDNLDMMDNLFTFRNVLIFAVILGIVLLICYQLGAL